jgi:hypothetical protein
MSKYLDDILIFIGCILFLIGVYKMYPVAVWFVAGIMLMAAGVAIGFGSKA